MAKPPPSPLAQAVAMQRYGGRPAELAHVTLLPFADLNEAPPSFVAKLLRAMRGFRAEAFHLCFDRIAEGQGVTLRSRRLQRSAWDFQEHLARFLAARGFTTFGKAPKVHLTINYRRDGHGDEVIARIGWCVEEVLLIESLHGQSRHEVHGRWRLDSLLL